jgi:hypothetical protein
MKKLGILMAVFGLFALVGVASASTTDVLQPASTITYNEELVVNATARFDSAYIGSTEAGVGGVTFFNGTMINNSVDEDGKSTIPLTLGDDVRIDGEIYRTEVGGDNPIKLADSIRPQTTATYDLGTEDNQFNDAYFAGTVTTADLSTEALTLTGALTGTTATLTGALTGTTATFSGEVTAQGDINQDLTDNGAMKAMVYVPYSGDCTDATSRQWTADGSVITCVHDLYLGVQHRYTLTFGTNDVSSRYWQVTPTVADADTDVVTHAYVYPTTGSTSQLEVLPYDETGATAQGGFVLTLY